MNTKPQYARDRMEQMGWSLLVNPDDCSVGWIKNVNNKVVAYGNSQDFLDDLEKCMNEADQAGDLLFG